MTLGAPADFPRRVLLAVCGLSPQVISETVYALSVTPRASERCRPTEIVVVTTRLGAERIHAVLEPAQGGVIARLCCANGLAPIHFDASTIHVVERDDGQPLEDIRSAADNERSPARLNRFPELERIKVLLRSASSMRYVI